MNFEALTRQAMLYQQQQELEILEAASAIMAGARTSAPLPAVVEMIRHYHQSQHQQHQQQQHQQHQHQHQQHQHQQHQQQQQPTTMASTQTSAPLPAVVETLRQYHQPQEQEQEQHTPTVVASTRPLAPLPAVVEKLCQYHRPQQQQEQQLRRFMPAASTRSSAPLPAVVQSIRRSHQQKRKVEAMARIRSSSPIPADPPLSTAASTPLSTPTSATAPDTDLQDYQYALFPNTPLALSALAVARSDLHPAIFNHSVRVYLYARDLLIKQAVGHSGSGNNNAAKSETSKTITFTSTDKFGPNTITITYDAPPTIQSANLVDEEAPKINHLPAAGVPEVNDRVLSLLFTACILHDIGTSASLGSEPQRFEVAGADAAAAIVRSQAGASEADADAVWQAVALHTSQGIAERGGWLTRLVRAAVTEDFSEEKASVLRAEIEAESEEWEQVQVSNEGEEREAVAASECTARRREIEEEFPRMGVEVVLADLVVEQAKGREEQKAPMSTWPGGLLWARMMGSLEGMQSPAF